MLYMCRCKESHAQLNWYFAETEMCMQEYSMVKYLPSVIAAQVPCSCRLVPRKATTPDTMSVI